MKGPFSPKLQTAQQERVRAAKEAKEEAEERDLFIDNLLVRIQLIIVMIRWAGLVPWEFEFPFEFVWQERVRAVKEAKEEAERAAEVALQLNIERYNTICSPPTLLGSYSKTVPRPIWWSWREGGF